MADVADAIPLREPARGALWGSEISRLSGLDMLRAFVEHRLPDPPVARLAGLRPSEVGLGSASASMPASPWWQSGAGVFLAGTLAFLADMPLGAAVLTSAPAGWGMTTSELSINFLRTPTIRSGTLIGRGRLIHATRTLGLSEATIADGHGRLLGHATSRCMLFELPSDMPPAYRHTSGSPDTPDPYLRAVEGDVRGREFWNSLSGREIMNQIAAGEFVPPCYLLMGLRGVETGDGVATLAMAKSPWLCNAFGVIYGGAIAYLADAAMIVATGSTVPAGTAFNTIDLKVNFLRPVLPERDELQAQAAVVHRGRTISLVNCDIVDASGKLAARASSSFLMLPGRFWEHPVHVGDELQQPANTSPS